MRNWNYALSTADVSPVTAPILLNGAIPENLKRAAEMGYQGIEVHMREDSAIDYEAIRSATERTGARISMVVTGRLNTEGKCGLMDDTPYSAQAALEGMYKYIDIASRLKAGLVIGWVKGNVPAGKPRGQYLDRLLRAMSAIDYRAGEEGVPLNIEVINRYETNVFNTCRETVDFIRENNLKNCFAHLDTFHMNIEEADIPEAIRLAGDKLGYFHAADNNRRYVGAGCLDFAAILKALEEINYQGWISVECLPLPSGDYAARASLERLKELNK